MQWDLTEREAREVIECRMREAWYKKHSRLSTFMAWWVIVLGLASFVLTIIFRETIKEWSAGQDIGIGLPVFLFFFWPGFFIYWRTLTWTLKAKKDAAILYEEPPP